MEEIASAWDEIDTMIGELESSALTEQEQELLTQYREHAANLAEARNEVIQLAEANKNGEAYALYIDNVEAMRKLVNDTLKAMQKLNVDNAGILNETISRI